VPTTVRDTERNQLNLPFTVATGGAADRGPTPVDGVDGPSDHGTQSGQAETTATARTRV
jgi:hypothetical protein